MVIEAHSALIKFSRSLENKGFIVMCLYMILHLSYSLIREKARAKNLITRYKKVWKLNNCDLYTNLSHRTITQRENIFIMKTKVYGMNFKEIIRLLYSLPDTSSRRNTSCRLMGTTTQELWILSIFVVEIFYFITMSVNWIRR